MTTARFDFNPTPIAGLVVVQRKPLEDERGFLSRFYCAEEFRKAGLEKPIAQINHTFTRTKGTVRGMHFQHPPYGESKVVGCLRGEVFDVAVDIRRGSNTFLRWYSEVLSAANQKSLLIPEGFAHGFQTLSEDCELIYLHTTPYASASEGGLNALDPRLAIAWPLQVADLSDRDRSHANLGDGFRGIRP